MDFYVILGLTRAATGGEIKRAYRRLARKHHPDINPGDRLAAAQFQQIAEAYETLIDPERRQRYDTGQWSNAPEAAAFGFEGFDFSVSVSGSTASTFGDLFADVFQQREGKHERVSERGADLHQTLTVDFDAAMRGGQRQVSVVRQEHCRTCQGAGWTQGPGIRCPQCHGTGAVKSARGHMVFSRACANCGGTGRLQQTRCPTCGGQQIEVRAEPVVVNLPAGLADGARVRVPGKGHVGRNGGESGDLYMTVRVLPHPVFRREGDDLHVAVPVAIHEAALGARIEVPSLEGSVRLRIPPGTQSGQRFRIHERGAPSVSDAQRGDLVVEVRLVLPRLLDERSKELLREFGRLNGDDVRQDPSKI